MIINLRVDFNPTTGKTKILSSSIEQSKTVEVSDSSEPQLILGKSNYTLNSAAISLLKVSANDKICIGYQPVGDKEFPVIGTETAFGCGGGNKLSKTNTVVYKGKQFERLSKFGTTFLLTPLKGTSGIYVLIGDAEVEPIPDDVQIIEDMSDHIDRQEDSLEPLTFDDPIKDKKVEDEYSISEDALQFS